VSHFCWLPTDYEVWQLNPGCGGCGRDNLPRARLCAYCGAELGVGGVELPAAGDPVLPEFPTTVALAQPTTALTDNATVWQRIVLGLAALLLVGFGWLNFYVGDFIGGFRGWGLRSLLVGLIFGAIFVVATVRPPSGTLRRLLVTLECLVLLVAVVLIGGALFIWWVFERYIS
jgi:hypothetical protein